MTDDISHGLALLADNAEPAPIDSYDVISRARARTRNRKATAMVFAAVVAVGALAVTLPTDHPSTTAAEPGESRAARLTAQLAAALPEVIPARWETRPTPPDNRPARTFGCPGYPLAFLVPPGQPSTVPPPPTEDESRHGTCVALAWYRDTVGEIDLVIGVSADGRWSSDPCTAPRCEEHVLPDGTRWRIGPDAGVSPGYPEQVVESLRPDGTNILVRVWWHNRRATPPMTTDELAKFADKFTDEFTGEFPDKFTN